MHAGSKLNVWEVHSASVRHRCLATARALCFVVDCREGSVGIEQGPGWKDVAFGGGGRGLECCRMGSLLIYMYLSFDRK